jgi:hypothetical protein
MNKLANLNAIRKQTFSDRVKIVAYNISIFTLIIFSLIEIPVFIAASAVGLTLGTSSTALALLILPTVFKIQIISGSRGKKNTLKN